MTRRFSVALLPFALLLVGLLMPSGSGRARVAPAALGVASSPSSICDPRWLRYSLPSPSAGWFSIYGMGAVSSSDVWAVGESVGGSGTEPAPVLHWDGSVWTRITFPGLEGAHLFGVAALSGNDVWIGGYTETSGRRMLLAHWDGSTWTTASALPNSGLGQVLSLAKIGSGGVWAVGSFLDQSSGRARALTMRWDGSEWVQVPCPYPVLNKKSSVPSSDGDSLLWSVSASGPNEAWAVGQYGTGGQDLPFIEHWDGTQWSIVPGPGLDATSHLTGVVSISTGDAWAAGYSNNQGGYLPLVLHWDGSSWTASSIPQVPLISHYSFAPLGVSATGPNDVWFASTSAGPPYKPVIIHKTSKGWDIIQSSQITMNTGAPLNVLAVSPVDVWVLGVTPQTSPGYTLAWHYSSPCTGLKAAK